jgi:tetratricopeptide (TPR) repeat protein
MRLLVWSIFIFLPIIGSAQYSRNLLRGEKYLAREEYNKAINALRQARSDSNSYYTNHLLGEAYFHLQEFQNAAIYYNHSLEFVGQDTSDYRQLYLTYNALKEVDKAQNILDLMVEYYPGIDSTMFYNWATQNINSPCTPDYGIRESLRYCIKIDASESIDPGNPNQKLKWRTDDGKSYNGPKLNHCFNNSGKHKIKLITEDNSLGYRRKSDTTLTVVFLDNNSLIMEQIPDKSNYIEVKTYNVENDSEIPYTFAWETGDGKVYFDEVLNHKYHKKGNYNIKLTIFEQVRPGLFIPICCIYKKCEVGT